MTITRRDFLRTVGSATAGLSIAVPFTSLSRGLGPGTASALQPRAFLRVGTDGIVTVWAVRLEMGQGVRTMLPMLVAEELEVEWSAIRVEQAPPDGSFKDIRIHTAGSGSAPGTHQLMRIAGATAREMLVTAAAQAWNVPARTCVARNGAVVHRPSGRRRDYGSLADEASRLPIPVGPRLKDPSQFTIIGRPMKRIDGPDIVTGKAVYGLDVVVPDMVFASIERAPTLGATLGSFDATAARRVPGVSAVIPVTRAVHAGVAVIARDSWSAMRGREALRVTWRGGRHAQFDSEAFLAAQLETLAGPLINIWSVGDAEAAMQSSERFVNGTYVYPFQAHAPLETMNCTADVRADSAEIWVSTQSDVRTMQEAVRVSGLQADRIRIHYALCGGAFGRRLFADFVAEAVELSKAIGKPVQLLWTRSDDMRHGYFQPATTDRYRAGIDAGGRLASVVHQMSAADLTIYDAHGGKDLWNTPRAPKTAEGFDKPPALYDFPAHRVDAADVTSPVPTGPWRAVESPASAFARESFIDEIAHAVGEDPLAYRLSLLRSLSSPPPTGTRLLSRQRLVRVIRELERRSNWLSPVEPMGDRLRGRGVAVSVYSTQSYIAMMAEVSIARDLSDIRVTRIMTVVDCGMPLNPLGIDGQTESAVAWGLSATLAGKMNFREGAAVESSYRDFQVLMIDGMPALETFIMESSEPPSGFGEHPVPLVAPAVANAVFAACGKRVRSLPITTSSLRG